MTDDDDFSDEIFKDVVIINIPPVAEFSFTPPLPSPGDMIQFTDESTGLVTSLSWDFGDGGTSTQQSPSYEYSEAGDYTVSLTLTGPGGGDTEVKESYIHVSEPICECDLVPDATVIPRGGTLGFDITVTNNTDEVQVFGFATYVTKPNGTKTGYLIGPVRVSLDPYGSKSAHKSHPIPGNAPLGTYTYHGVVGTPAAGLYDKCQFNFEVVP